MCFVPPKSVWNPPQISRSLMIVMMILGEINLYNFSVCPTALIRLPPKAHLNTHRIESNENILDRSVVWISTKCLISFNRWKNKKQVFIVSTNILRTIEGDVDEASASNYSMFWILLCGLNPIVFHNKQINEMDIFKYMVFVSICPF